MPEDLEQQAAQAAWDCGYRWGKLRDEACRKPFTCWMEFAEKHSIPAKHRIRLHKIFEHWYEYGVYGRPSPAERSDPRLLAPRYKRWIDPRDYEDVAIREVYALRRGLPLDWLMEAALQVARSDGFERLTEMHYAFAQEIGRPENLPQYIREAEAEGNDWKAERARRLAQWTIGQQKSLFNPAGWRDAAYRAGQTQHGDAREAMASFLRHQGFAPYWRAMRPTQRAEWERVWRSEFERGRRRPNPKPIYREELPDGRIIDVRSFGSSQGIRLWHAALYGPRDESGDRWMTGLDIKEMKPKSNLYGVFFGFYDSEKDSLGRYWPKRYEVLASNWVPLREAKQRAIEMLRKIKTREDILDLERRARRAVGLEQ